ncbi:hypothetical protein [uncultured Victivallis sp.]|uniref:hypothetical protein n=1 Tax=uncultured Victivallis sp. TaxID=354118 RepID=UPI0025DE88F2|nr:hypothetical protein [uncultured Victivallis sp.]
MEFHQFFRKSFAALVVAGVTMSQLAAADVIGIQQGKGLGTLDFSTVFRIVHFGVRGQFSSQRHKAFPAVAKCRGTSMAARGEWVLPEDKIPVKFDFSAELNKTADAGRFTYKLEAQRPVPTRMLVLQFELPESEMAGKEILFDGAEPVVLPETCDKYRVAMRKQVQKLSLPLRNGRMEISLSRPVDVTVNDNRKNKIAQYQMNLSLLPAGTRNFTSSELELSMHLDPYRVEPLPFGAAANSTFADEHPADRKGGWTDQGALLDLRQFPKGKPFRALFAEFDIPDGEKSGTPECIVLGGLERNYLPKSATLRFSEPKTMRTLVLLHALAWAKRARTGTIEVNFSDGSRREIPVNGGHDVGDWWNPYRMRNGEVVWKCRNDENDVGLYLSCFPIPEKPVSSITFSSTGTSVWMIAGAAASPQSIRLGARKEYTFSRNADWREFRVERRTVPGSALDFSFLLDAPAGKYGFLQVKNGHFVFEKQPDVPIRFYGANLCTSACTPSKEEANAMSDYLARIGYNCIRFHHYDRELVRRKIDNSVTFDPEKLDRFDYLIYALKKRGLYLSIDLFSLRDRIPGEFKSAPRLSDMKDYKLAAMVIPEVRENLKSFARQLLLHRNPYTGLSLAEEPALTGICIINENMIISLYDDCKLLRDGESAPFVDRAFEAYCRKNGITVTNENHRQELNRFLYRLYEAYYREMRSFLRDELKVCSLLTDQNHRQPPLACSLREQYDYVDCHIYWEHPQYIGRVKWVPPYLIRNTSMVQGDLWPIRMLAPARLFGKPFTVTEFNSCFPNEVRGEAAAIFGAYGALQEWDGLFRFDYAGSPQAIFGTPDITPFHSVNDPVRILSERIAAAFFIRRDIAPATRAVPLLVRPGAFEEAYVENYPPAMQRLAFQVRTGSISAPADKTPPLPPGTVAPWRLGQPAPEAVRTILECEKGSVTSCTGEITADFRSGAFRAASARSEALAIPAGGRLTGKRLSINARQGAQTVAAIALENAPLEEAGRILLLFLTDVRQEGIIFSSQEDRVVLKEAPRTNAILARRGIGEITLELSAKYEVIALDCAGEALGTVPVRFEKGKLQFIADNFSIRDRVIFAYELKRVP